MSDTEDPTKKYPPAESYRTNMDLKKMLEEIIDEKLKPVLDRIERDLTELKTEQKTGFRKLDRRLNAMDVKLADNATRLDALEDNAA
jgi:maltodextrin utilization protein YvdJ